MLPQDGFEVDMSTTVWSGKLENWKSENEEPEPEEKSEKFSRNTRM
jgi:hypothetical protein